MFSKIVLAAFPDRLTAGLWHMGRLRSCQSFHNGEAGLENFRQFLRQHKNTPIYLIVDAVEEDYRLETLPHTFGQARRGLVERRLGQLYRNVRYRAASLVGREKDKRRDDIYLFQALNNADSINPWVQVIEELRAPLAGITLLPMVSQALVNRLKLLASDMLLTDWQGTGLRQTYFQQGRLRVSRLAPAVDPSQERLAELYEVETEKTRLYLLSQRLIGRDTRLSLLVLAPKQQGEAICRHIGVDPGIECRALDTVEIARKLGLQRHLNEFPELLHMQVLAKWGMSVNLASQEQTRSYWIQRMSGILWLSSAALLLGGFLGAAVNLLGTMDYRTQTETAAVQTRTQEDLYKEVARNFPSTPQSGENLRIAVEMSDTIAANTKTPLRLMQIASAALNSTPEIVLQRLRWKQTTDINSKDDIAQPQTSATQGPSESTGTLYEIGFLDGEIRNFQGDYRAALDSVNRLADRMRKDPEVEQVQVVQQPVNVSSQTNLQGSTLDAAAQQMPAAQFKLRIILKPKVAQP